MSGSHTPESITSVSSRSSSSGRRLDSNTTPSPSGGNRSPKFNPRALSNRLAMLEASQALAKAASTLSTAAQAMSKAAASLAAVSDYSDDEYTYEAGYYGNAEDWTGSPDWARSSYSLQPRPDSSRDEPRATDEGYNLEQINKNVPLDGDFEPQQDGVPEQGGYVHASGSPLPSEKQPFTPQAATTKIPLQAFPGQSASSIPSNPIFSVANPISVSANRETDLPPKGNATKKGFKHGARANEDINTAPVSIPGTITETPQASAKDCSGLSDSSAPSGQPTGPTYIILERGFDSLPALCHLVERCAKTVCIYNYPGTVSTTVNIEAMLKKNTKLPVMMPESMKQDRLVSATRKFNLAPSGILVWPGCKKLTKIIGLANSSDSQLVHIGEPNQANADITCLKITLILAKSNFGQPQERVPANRSPDPSNDICNQQGSWSPLEAYRVWLRSRFSQNACARGIYWDWILQFRKQQPKRGVVEVVRLANQFAEEFLLRGKGEKYGDPVGGQVTVTDNLLRGHQMEQAVKAGLLLIS